MIEVEHLTKRFGPTVAVKDVSFSIKRGEVIGFLGPNAAGKTTTMRVLTGFLPADEGTVRLAGHDVRTDSLAVRAKVGYLPENSPLYADMDVVGFLEYIARLRKIPAAEIPKRLEAVIDACGLGSVKRKPISVLSKGFRQRVGLAQCLIHEPEILILDEPTSGLDPNQIIEIRNLIREIGREKTVILSTHILQEVQATCGRVLIINRGQIVADGTPEELALHSRSGTRVLVSTRADAEAVKRGLSSLEGVTRVRQIKRDGDVVRFAVESDREQPELPERVFRAAAANGWVLSELRLESATLEEVFKQLTEGAA
jgi:ABC-2 type transport system ATP-binding protein